MIGHDELIGKEQMIAGSRDAASMKQYYDKIREHGKKVVQKWSTTTSTLLYPGEELISPDVKIALDPISTHKYLTMELVEHFVPRYVVNTEGNSLTSTGQSMLELLSRVGKGWRTVIGPFIINFFNMILEKNGFMDLEVTCKWPNILPEDKDQIYNQAMGALEQAIIPRSRFLSMMGWDQLTDVEKSELEEYWKFRSTNQVT